MQNHTTYIFLAAIGVLAVDAVDYMFLFFGGMVCLCAGFIGLA